MILIPMRRGLDLLNLFGYSYQDAEFNIVHRFFKRNDYIYDFNDVSNDSFDRKGVLYTLSGKQQIQRFEQQLAVDFQENVAIFHTISGGKTYRCMRIKDNASMKPNCIDLDANDDDEAFILCAMHANDQNWFGGKSERGRCRDK